MRREKDAMVRTAGKMTRRGGFTLTELAIVMAMIGLIVAGIWWAAGKARESQRADDALTEMQTVVQNIDAMMTGQKFSTAGNITSSMITAQVIPSTYATSGPWGGSSLAVWAQTAGTSNFRVAMYNVGTQGSCIALLLKMVSCQSGQSGCPTQVGTGGNTTTAPTAANIASPGGAGIGWTNMTVSAATALCGANSYSGGNNSVEFYYAP